MQLGVSSHVGPAIPHNKVMGFYHELRTSESFLSNWKNFSRNAAGENAHTQIQAIRERLFRKLPALVLPLVLIVVHMLPT